MSTASIDDARAAVDAYKFRNLHPNVRSGTAGDRYGGWVGQIYPSERYADRITTRSRKLGGETFTERRVPIESVRDYFEHFDVLEIDFTFYRPLHEDDGEPSSNYFALSKYADHAPDDASFLLKAPQQFFARTLRRNGEYVDNPGFLDATNCIKTFHEPAVDILGDRLDGVIFQQEYQRVGDSPSPDENVDQLDDFFTALPDEIQPHLELRSKHLLSDSYFDWLDTRGLGHVFSHWTWLPPIRKQWAMAGERFTSSDGRAVARLLTPHNVKYAEAYATAHPFDEPKPELSESEQAQDMVLDTTALTFRAVSQNTVLNVIASNRAWGNAPDLNRAIAHRILDEEERRRSS